VKVYILIQNDRHTDPEATPYLSKDDVISDAKALAEQCRRGGPVVEEEIDGWIYFVEYGSEGDCIWVVEHDLDISETP
jgi:hypothetical protein